MKSIISLILIFCFSLSAGAGKSFCCNDSGNPLLAENSNHNNGPSENQGNNITSVSSICDLFNHSHSSDHNEEHQCLGCSHAPFLSGSVNFISILEFSEKIQFLEFNFFLPNPFLDGPFQPPKFSC